MQLIRHQFDVAVGGAYVTAIVASAFEGWDGSDHAR